MKEKELAHAVGFPSPMKLGIYEIFLQILLKLKIFACGSFNVPPSSVPDNPLQGLWAIFSSGPLTNRYRRDTSANLTGDGSRSPKTFY